MHTYNNLKNHTLLDVGTQQKLHSYDYQKLFQWKQALKKN